MKFLKKNYFPIQNIFYIGAGASISKLFKFIFESYLLLDLKAVFKLNDFKIGLIYIIISIISLFVIFYSKKISDNLDTKIGKRTPIIIIGCVGCIVSLSMLTYLVAVEQVVLFIIFIFIGMFFKNIFFSIGPTLMSETTPNSYIPIGVSIFSFIEDFTIIIFLFFLSITHSGDLKTIHYPVGFIMVLIMIVYFVIFIIKTKEKKFITIMKKKTLELEYGKIVTKNIDRIYEDITKTPKESAKFKDLDLKFIIPIMTSTLLIYMAIDAVLAYSSRYITFSLKLSIQTVNNFFVIQAIVMLVVAIPIGIVIEKIGSKNSFVIGVSLMIISFIPQFLLPFNYYRGFFEVVSSSTALLLASMSSFSFLTVSIKKNATSLALSIYYIVLVSATIFNQIFSSLLFEWELKTFHTEYNLLPVYIIVLSLIALVILPSIKTDKKLFNRHGDKLGSNNT